MKLEMAMGVVAAVVAVACADTGEDLLEGAPIRGAKASTSSSSLALTLTGRGERLALEGVPADPAYRADYPNPTKVAAMNVVVGQDGRVTSQCPGAAADACTDPPFFATLKKDRGTWRVLVRDLYGVSVASFATVPPSSTSSANAPSAPQANQGGGDTSGGAPPPPTGGAGGTPPPTDSGGGTPTGDSSRTPPNGGVCDVHAKEVTLCGLINDAIHAKGVDFRLDCTAVSDDKFVPPIPPHIPTRFAPCVALVPWMSAGMPGCPADESAAVLNWLSDANMQLMQQGVCQHSPLVLDLDGDGIHLSDIKNGVPFDLLGDGTRVRAAWVDGKDALLALDRNEDGQIDGASELFGNATGGAHYADGFEALAELDANGDGRVDTRDTDFTRLVLWKDQNRDGVGQASELQPLTEAGLVSLPTTATRIVDSLAVDTYGNDVSLRSTFLRSDGSRGVVVDAFLRFQLIK